MCLLYLVRLADLHPADPTCGAEEQRAGFVHHPTRADRPLQRMAGRYEAGITNGMGEVLDLLAAWIPQEPFAGALRRLAGDVRLPFV